MTPIDALKEIQRILCVPTKETPFRTLNEHLQADCEAVRKICAAVLNEKEAPCK